MGRGIANVRKSILLANEGVNGMHRCSTHALSPNDISRSYRTAQDMVQSRKSTSFRFKVRYVCCRSISPTGT